MRKQIILATLVAATLGSVCPGRAQEPRDFSLLATQIVRLPDTTYSITFNSPALQVGESRDIAALSVAVGAWLSARFGLPAMHRPPRVQYVSVAEIENRQSAGRPETATVMENPAVYDWRARTIYLPEGWNGSTPFELSLFVRQLVHHLQNEAADSFRCAPDGDAFALAVQRQWLALFGSDGQPTSARLEEPISRPRCTLRQSRAGD
jgi:hypothetical protein